MVPQVQRQGPATGEARFLLYIRNVPQAPHAVCEIPAILVGILRQSPRRRRTHLGRRHSRTPGVVSEGFGGQGNVRPKERGEVTLVGTPNLETDVDQRHVGRGQ
jgi:hypothetical protein